MDRTDFNLGRDELTRLALTSQDARIVEAAITEMNSRGNVLAEILEYANAHLVTLKTRDKAMEMLRHYTELVPRLEQRIKELEAGR